MSSGSQNSIALEPLSLTHIVEFGTAVEASHQHVTPWLTDKICPRPEQNLSEFIEQWQEKAKSQQAFGFFVKDLDTQSCAGFGLLNHFNPTHRFANLGYWVSASMLGRGYGAQITQSLALFAFQELGQVRVELLIDPENTASRKVAEKSGAKFEGMLRNRLRVNDVLRDAMLFSIVPADLGLE